MWKHEGREKHEYEMIKSFVKQCLATLWTDSDALNKL